MRDLFHEHIPGQQCLPGLDPQGGFIKLESHAEGKGPTSESRGDGSRDEEDSSELESGTDTQ